MKKSIVLTITAGLLLFALAACGGTSGAGGPITVISREDGSGTRGAFIELFGIEEKDASGEKMDMTLDSAEITNNTSVMMSTVASDPNAIGYLSLGSLGSSVKALKIDGVAPSIEAIKDGSYAISRPFNVATTATLSPAAVDFLSYIMSSEGQDVVEEKGYIRMDDTGVYISNKASGKLVVGGSSSVSPVMESLKEAYAVLNPDVTVELQSSDSTTGMNAVLDGICEIGMASRALKDSERTAGLQATVIAQDGIVVAVNPENTTEDLSRAQVKDIYTGAISDWSALQ